MSELVLTTPAAWVACPKCGTQLPCYNPASSRYFACGKCRSYSWSVPEAVGKAQRRDGFKQTIIPGPSLPLGQVAELGGYRCRVTGYQVRGERQDRTAEWREYQLTPATPLPGDELPLDFPLQLAEYQGHWLLIRRAAEYPAPKGDKAIHDKEWRDSTGRQFKLWHRYQPVLREARGEFDWDILEDEQLKIQEYTAAPYLLTREQRGQDAPAWYLAEHLEPEQVAAAFGMSYTDLPERQGVGAAQPGPVQDWPQLKRLALVAVGVLTAMQLVFSFRPRTPHEAQHFTITETAPGASIQMLVSPSFEIRGDRTLSIELETFGLTNHWVEVTASLVNEQTGRGYEFTRALEYYEGVESGESWSEGSRTAEATLSAVPAGRYHFNLYPSADAGTGSTELTLRLSEETAPWSNYFLALLGLGLLPLGVRWRRHSFEVERWQNSDFNPYATSES
jgi:hypothetical protein